MQGIRTISSAAMVMGALGCGALGCGAPKKTAKETASDSEKNDGEYENLVAFSLIADSSRVSAGQELTVGAHFKMKPEWHIYWINPGDSGLPTEVELTSMPALPLPPLNWPGPHRYELEGDIVNYGYDTSVTLWTNVTMPDELPSEGVTFVAKASWLACREACVQGEAKAELNLATAGPENPATPSNREIFEIALEQTPLPLAAARDQLIFSWQNQTDLTAKLTFKGAEKITYFPTPEEPLSGSANLPVPDGIELQLRYQSQPASRGVIAVMRAGATQYFINDIPLPQNRQ